MNDEIKEILEHIKLYPEKIYCLSEKEKIIILDYITNLQQENEYLKKNNPEQNIEHFRIIKENKRKINNLREENEDNLKCIKNLKEQLESVIKNNQELLEKWHKNNDKIVNLISENERLKENNSNMQEEMARVWEENERLKEILKWKQNRESELFTIESVLETNKQLYDERNIYKSRCEKAVEYIESTTFFGLRSGKTFMSKYLNDLLNILQNGSEKDE